MPISIKTRTTNSEIKVRIPQMSVTLLLRTAVSSARRLHLALAGRKASGQQDPEQARPRR